MLKYIDSSISYYIKKLSSKKNTPGGGSASAVNALLGCGLNLMVLNFSIKDINKKSKNEILLKKKNNQNKYLNNIFSFVDEDCIAFENLMKSVSLNKNTQKEFKRAATIPFNICKEAYKSIKITQFLFDNGNKNLLTDVICASNMLYSAFNSASINVAINLKYIKNKDFVKKKTKSIIDMGKEVNIINFYINEKTNFNNIICQK